MTDPKELNPLARALRAERRAQRMSLRDLAAEIGVSFNTLSRVEHGHIPDLTNYERIVGWLGVPITTFLEPDFEDTPDLIARHLYTDSRLSPEDAETIADVVQQMYAQLALEESALSVHMRSAKTFLPAAGDRLASVLEDMHRQLAAEDR